MSIIACFIDLNYGDLAKLILCNIQTFILLKIIFDKSTPQILIFTIIEFLISAFAELLFSLAIVYIFNLNVENFMNNILGEWVGNIVITCTYFGIMQIKVVQKFCKKIVSFGKSNSKFEIFFLFLLVISLLSAITYPVVVSKQTIYEKLTFCLIFISFIYFIGNFFYQRTKNEELKKEYDYLLDYAKEYEKALEEKSKTQHEYKNQLIVIKSMVDKKNKKLQKYLDEMLDYEENKKVIILNNLKNIPSGGLKGLIYYKMERMLEKNMEVHINVDSLLSNEKYWNLCEENLKSVSAIIGVYLDNAIEAASQAEKKYIIIDIDLEEENLIFSFSNTYKGHIEVSKIDKQGYSTKGKARGYGLSLVQDILNKNSFLSQKREINGIFYVQKLIIQNKK
jgi:two-component system sensor histidine kinase AgrC